MSMVSLGTSISGTRHGASRRCDCGTMALRCPKAASVLWKYTWTPKRLASEADASIVGAAKTQISDAF